MEVKDVGVINVKGRNKDFNEDYHYAVNEKLFNKHEAYFLTVADGMGGHDEARQASHIAIETLENWWEIYIENQNDIDGFVTNLEEGLLNCFNGINDELISRGNDSNMKIGTTLSVLILVDNFYFVYHIGDARIYYLNYKMDDDDEKTSELFLSNGLNKLTSDHTLLQSKLDSGELIKSEIKDFKQAGVLTQCLGVKGDIHPYATFGTVQDDYIFFLCTDGVYKYVSDKKIETIIEKNIESASQQIVDLLYNEVKESEFKDDICILLIK